MSFTVRDQELLAILGPSGAGKTTLLRLIAGVETPTSGEILFDGKPAAGLAPEERQVAMVFEDYLLYPHLSVRENLASSLRALKWPEEKRCARIEGMAEVLQIAHLLDRYPGQLSGGQRQRVALGRALVKPAQVYLMDEPIAHLDAKLRHRMRGELTQMCRRLKSTIIYVTHDYREALAIAHRVLVLRAGRVEQVGTPGEIYSAPATRFVADFVGEPPMNLIDGALIADAGGATIEIAGKRFELPEAVRARYCAAGASASRNVTIGMRARHLEVSTSRPVGPAIEGTVYVTETVGRKEILTCSVRGALVQSLVSRGIRLEPDETVWLVPDLRHVVLFDLDPGAAV